MCFAHFSTTSQWISAQSIMGEFIPRVTVVVDLVAQLICGSVSSTSLFYTRNDGGGIP